MPQRLVIAAIPALLVLGLLAAQIRLAHSLNVNWDEFNFLSKIHSYARGELASRLLTFHVHLLGWVRDTSANEVVQVLRIRDAMCCLILISASATFIIGRSLLGSVAGALFAVFAGQSFSLVLNHGTSARYDPIVVCLFLLAAALLLNGSRRAASLSGLLTALCLLISVKGVLYLPTLVGLMTARLVWGGDRRATVHAAISFGLSALISAAALFGLHAASLTDPSPLGPAGRSTVDALGGISSTVFMPLVGLARRGVFVRSLRWDTGFWVLLVVGAGMAAFGLRPRQARQNRLHNMQLLCFILPLFSLFFYRNSFAYFYVSIVPPAALLAGVVAARIEKYLGHLPWLAAVVVALLAAPSAGAAVRWLSYNSDDQLSTQKLVIDVVHSIFPNPVPYVDRCGMISSFPKVGPFMSTWTMSDYQERRIAMMRELLIREKPQFLLKNIAALDLSRPYSPRRRHRFLPEDFDALTQSFIPYWGPLWIAGKLMVVEANTASQFEMLVAGPYVAEADSGFLIDGRPIVPGQLIELAAGAHAIASTVRQVVKLRTASAGPPPTTAPPGKEIFSGFGYRRVALDDDAD